MEIETRRGRFELIDRGEGTTLVLIHGFPFSAESWSADAEALAGRMRVVAPSMRGFGTSDTSELASLSIDNMADDVCAILDALRLEGPVVLGGLSMGGYVTLSFARRFPGRLRAMVLADTRAEPDTEEGRANRDKGIARIEGGDRAGFVEALFDIILAPSTRSERPDIVERVRAMAMRAPPASLSAGLRALRDRPDARPGLGSISVPTLVIVGEEDLLTPPSSARAMVEAMAAGQVSEHVIPRAGHLSNLEQPEAFQRAVAAFVARLADPPGR